MNRKLKALGLALFATMALGAISAQGAMGAELFHSEINETYITGIQEHDAEVANVFELDDPNNSALECTNATFEGSITASTVTEVELTPTYFDCETDSGANAAVDHTECTYVLAAHTEGDHAPVEVVCPDGQAIHISIESLCNITVGADDTISEGLTYANEETEDGTEDITATITAHDIGWQVSSGEFFCTLGGLGASSGTDATYFSSVTVEGYADAGHTELVDIWHEES